MSLSRFALFVSTVVLFGLLWGCRGVDKSDGRNDDQGEVSVAISANGESSFRTSTGAVLETDVVQVTIVGIDFYPQGSGTPETIDLDTPLTIDLTDYRGIQTELLLDEERLPIGTYERIGLVLSSTETPKISFRGDDSLFDLTIPPADDVLLIVDVDFNVADDSELEFTLNFDAKQSLVEDDSAPGTYLLKPHLRAVETDEAGAITGTVVTTLFDTASECDTTGDNNLVAGNHVYAFSGSGSVTQDIRGDAADPFATAPLTRNGNDFSLGFLPAGFYTLVFTCDGELDEIDEENEPIMEFTSSETIEVRRAGVATVNFDD